MPFDNAKLTAWLADFKKSLIECGMPEPQAKKFRGEHFNDAVAYLAAGQSPDSAAVREIMNL